MKTMNIGEFKNHLKDLIKNDKSGEPITVIHGKTKHIVGYYMPVYIKQTKRKLGILEGKVKVTFTPDFKMTTEEFLGLK